MAQFKYSIINTHSGEKTSNIIKNREVPKKDHSIHFNLLKTIKIRMKIDQMTVVRREIIEEHPINDHGA